MDRAPPTISALTPRVDATDIRPRAPIVLRIEDRGTAKIDKDTIQLVVNGTEIITNGVVLPDTGWETSQVRPWEEGATPTVVELHIVKTAVHAYGEQLVVLAAAADNSGNEISRTFTYTVEESPVYDGTDGDAVLSPLELSLLTPFVNTAAETFRKRVLFGLVPGAVPESTLERQAVRRLVQLLYRYEQDPVMSRMYVGEPKHSNKTMPDARTYSDLLTVYPQFAEAMKQVLYTVSRIVDEGLLDHVRALTVNNAVAASLVLLTLLCKIRDVEGSLRV